MSIVTDRLTAEKKAQTRYGYWVLILIALGFLGLWLGHWQWQKANIKERQEQQQQPRLLLSKTSDLDWLKPSQWLGRNVEVTGRYGSGFVGMLDNQTVAGQAGVDVITVFEVKGGGMLLVNRGWIATPDRQHLPPITQPDSWVTVRGQLYPPSRPGILLGEYPAITAAVQRLPWVDSDIIGSALGIQLPPAEVRLSDGQASSFTAHWQLSVMTAAKHRGYAWQWWALTLMAWGYAIWIYQQRKQAFKQAQACKPI